MSEQNKNENKERGAKGNNKADRENARLEQETTKRASNEGGNASGGGNKSSATASDNGKNRQV